MKQILTVFRKASKDVRADTSHDNCRPRETVHQKNPREWKTYSHTGQHLSFKLGTQLTHRCTLVAKKLCLKSLFMDSARKMSSHFRGMHFRDGVLKLQLQGWIQFELFQKRWSCLCTDPAQPSWTAWKRSPLWQLYDTGFNSKILSLIHGIFKQLRRNVCRGKREPKLLF